MTQQRSHFFWTSMMMCALRRSSVKRAFCRRSFWTSSSIGLRLDFGPRFCGVRASRIPWARSLVASRSAETNTDLRGGEGCQGHLASSQRLRLHVRCVVCAQLCRSAASGLATTFGIRPQSRPQIAARFGCLLHPPLRLARRRASAPFRASPPGERTTPRELPFISDLFFLALLLIN